MTISLFYISQWRRVVGLSQAICACFWDVHDCEKWSDKALSTYMFSSPMIQIAERILTISVIMLVCLGSIALANSNKLLSSPKILCSPYCETWRLGRMKKRSIGYKLMSIFAFIENLNFKSIMNYTQKKAKCGRL